MGRRIWDDMEETSDNPAKPGWIGFLRVLKPALPAVIGAAALIFLFAAVMPLAWVAAISWNLYLDRLSDFFVPPVGNGGRLALALGMAAVAAVLAGFIALLIARPEAAGLSSLRRRFRSASGTIDDDDSEEILTRRRRVDLHPDDAPRPPIRAGRDLPAGGLGPVDGAFADESAAPESWPGEPAEAEVDELVLADLAPGGEVEASDEPWLQPAEVTGPVKPDPADNSLGAMVARLEAGLARRRQGPGIPAVTTAIPVPEGTSPDSEPEVDLALEAALSTLQRMTRQSVG